jgi:hypothetical protein
VHEQTSFETTGRGLLIKIAGTAGRMRYLAAIAFDGEYRQALNLLADRLETEGAEIQTLSKRRDVAQRAVVTTYAPADGGYSPKSTYTVYLLDGPRKPLHRRLVPYALFEAVKAGDFVEARSFLTESLNAEVKDDGALADFFADFTVMRESLYYPDMKNTVLLTGDGKGELLEFAYVGEKINDMKIL